LIAEGLGGLMCNVVVQNLFSGFEAGNQGLIFHIYGMRMILYAHGKQQ